MLRERSYRGLGTLVVLSLATSCFGGEPAQAPAPPQAPEVEISIVPPQAPEIPSKEVRKTIKRKKACSCSESCTCGCNEGLPCQCNPVGEHGAGTGCNAPSEPVQRYYPPVQQYQPQRFYQPVQNYQPVYRTSVFAPPVQQYQPPVQNYQPQRMNYQPPVQNYQPAMAATRSYQPAMSFRGGFSGGGGGGRACST